MKKIYNKLIITLIFFVSVFVLKSSVKANTIEKVDMNVYIDKNGNGNVTEVWEAILT